jgi:hypothetical protein
LDGTQFVANSIIIRSGLRGVGPQLFDVFTNLPLAPGVVVAGGGPSAVSLPLFSYPAAPSVIPGTDSCPAPGRKAGDCVVRALRGPVTLQPGSYNNIVVKGGALLYFAGGTYNVRSIRGSGHARFYFNGPTTLNVQEGARFGQRVFFGPPVESTLSGRCIVMNVGGSRAMKFAGSSNVTATVVAPELTLKLGAFGDYRGQFIAANVLVGRNALLEAPPSLTSPCQ